jgi:hypothetical protein
VIAMQMWMLGGVFALVGAPMIWLAVRAFARDRAIAAWPRARGVIVSRRLASSTHSYRDRDGFNRTDTLYRPIVQYTYTVDGQALEGNRIHRNDDTATGRAAAQRDIDRYAAQQEVMVLYDPADPKTAYLETRLSIGGVILCAFGGLWVGLGALLTVLSFL